MIVLDASAAAALLLNQPAAAAIVTSLDAHRIVGPELLGVELLSILRGWVRGRDLEPTRAEAALEDLEDLGVSWYPERPLLRLAWGFRDNASAYDAIYLALAEALSEPGRRVKVLTLDRRLARAFSERALLPA